MLLKSEFIRIFTTSSPELKSGSNDIYFTSLSMDGIEEMHRYSIDERLYEYFEFDPFIDISDTEKYLRKLLKRMSGHSEKRVASYWFVRRSDDDYLIGTAGLLNLDYGRQSIEWGYGIDPELWGLGYVLKIQESLKKFVFDRLCLNRLHGITMVTNLRTIESVLASGMKHEGTARDYYRKDGDFIDGWQYAMTKSDYDQITTPKLKQKLTISTADIIKVIGAILGDDEINECTSMENTPGWDSLNHMEIMIALKEELSMTLSPEEISKATSVRTLSKLIEQKSNNR